MELKTQTLLPSPTSRTSPSFPTTPKQLVQQPRSDTNNPYPTTFVHADTSSFKQVVQMLTGSTPPTPTPKSNNPNPNPNINPNTNPNPNPNPNPIPPIKTTPNKSKLYERRSTTLKNLRLTTPSPAGLTSHDILSPSLLNFPSLVLSPVTPLIPDPFINGSPISSTNSQSSSLVLDQVAEQKAIADKGFFLHPSPVSTPRDSEPRLLPLFPLSSPWMLSGSNQASS